MSMVVDLPAPLGPTSCEVARRIVKPMSNVSTERIGMNESLFRDANEGIERGLWPGEEDRQAPFRCECAAVTCAEVVRLTPVDYEAVRENPRRFVVVTGHEVLRAEVVVERHPEYLVVEKFGDAAAVAEDRDPRS
jgi:hypothetical protein